MRAPRWPTVRTPVYTGPWMLEREPRTLRGVAKFMPSALSEEAKAVEEAVPDGDLPPAGGYVMLGWRREPIILPGRVYNEPIAAEAFDALSPSEQLVATVLYSRHHDGYVREDAVRQLLDVEPGWQSLYLLMVVGEAPAEVAKPIAELAADGSLASDHLLESLTEVARENPRFFRTVRSQARSYWHAYYRRDWPDPTAYPPIDICRRVLARLARDEILDWSGARTPDGTLRISRVPRSR